MKIYYKNENGRRYYIQAPMCLVKAALGMGGFGMRFAKRHVPEDQIAYLEMIDFKTLGKAFDELKAYKGLKMVDVKTKDGVEVKIII